MEEQKRRKNWQDFVTAKQIDRYNAIQMKVEKTKKLSRTDGTFLKEFDKKTIVCNSCGRTVDEAKAWEVVSYENPNGEMIPFGYSLYCFECAIKDIMRKGEAGLL